jgi:hypothetical protein
METISITREDLQRLVETAIQFGLDSPDLVASRRGKIADWMIENTINDIQEKS